jgi:hypothetical protein
VFLVRYALGSRKICEQDRLFSVRYVLRSRKHFINTADFVLCEVCAEE